MTASTRPEVRAFPDAEAVARAAATAVAELLASAPAGRPLSVVLAGGSTPRRLYELLAEAPGAAIPWPSVHLFWGDERCVPPTDPASNYGMARASLIARVSIPAENVHRVPTEVTPYARAAAAYEGTLRAFFGTAGPRFDLVILGLGRDGHTASLFPGHPVLQERERWVAAVEVDAAAPAQRITLTLPVLNQARATFFAVTGADKAKVAGEILHDPAGAARYPAARVRGREQTVWFVDHAALGRDLTVVPGT